MLMINSTIFMRSHKVPGTVVLGVQLKLYRNSNNTNTVTPISYSTLSLTQN